MRLLFHAQLPPALARRGWRAASGRRTERREAFDMATWEDVRRLALGLPGTTEGTSRGTNTWLVDGKTFVWERPLRRADLAALGERAPAGPILGARTGDLEAKEALLAAEAAAFTTPHFDGYAAILIDLAAIDVARLEPIVVEAWLVRARKRVAAAYLQDHKQRHGGA